MSFYDCPYSSGWRNEPEKIYTFTERQLRQIIDTIIIETANKLGFQINNNTEEKYEGELPEMQKTSTDKKIET